MRVSWQMLLYLQDEFFCSAVLIFHAEVNYHKTNLFNHFMALGSMQRPEHVPDIILT